MERKKILLISTGGTIVCRDRGRGLVPVLSGADLLRHVPRVSELCDTSTVDLYRLDSTDMTPVEWQGVAAVIHKNYDAYDGFIVTHGTDTLAYASAALSCLMRNSPKPIALTGSQIPMGQRGSDAPDNLLDAFIWVCHPEARGVHIVFAGRVIRGMRARKRHTTDTDAFESVNCPDRATIRSGRVMITPHTAPVRYPAAGLSDKLNTNVALAHLTPGMSPALIARMAEGLDALVVEGVGIGGIPDTLTPILTELADNGLWLVLTSQVPYGTCDFTVYRVGRRIAEACGERVITTRDVPVEATFAAAMWALTQEDFPTAFTRALKGDM